MGIQLSNLVAYQKLAAASGRFNALSASHTKWSSTLKKFVDCCQQIVGLCLTIFGVGV